MTTYIKDVTKLREVAQELYNHDEDIMTYYRSQISHRVKNASSIDKMKRIFYAETKARAGASKANSEAAYDIFNKDIKDRICMYRGKSPEEQHKSFLDWLCTIPQINQKIANLYIKHLVNFSKEFKIDGLDFPLWKEYLHVPLDRWVLELLWYPHLAVGTKKYNKLFSWGKDKKNERDVLKRPNFSYYDKNHEINKEYNQLQKELKEAIMGENLPPITLDNLWFVGHNFCMYDKKLCEPCWINEWCVKKEIKKEDYAQTI